MAQLPGGEWLIQRIEVSPDFFPPGTLVVAHVVLFHRHTEEEIVRFDPSDADETAKAQGVIALCDQLDAEQKSFAHFWSGYFYAYEDRKNWEQ